MKKEYLDWLCEYLSKKGYISTFDLLYFNDDEELAENTMKLSNLFYQVEALALESNKFPRESAYSAYFIIKYNDKRLCIGMSGAKKPIYFCSFAKDKLIGFDIDADNLLKENTLVKTK